MEIHLFPTTRLGLIGTVLAALAFLEFLAGYVFAELYKVITSDLLITVFGVIAIVAAIIGAVFAAIAVRKEKERSILAFLSIALGILAGGFLLGNLLGIPGI